LLTVADQGGCTVEGVRSAATLVLGLRVWIPPGAWMCVPWEYFLLCR